MSPETANGLDEKATRRLIAKLGPEFRACDAAADAHLGRREGQSITKASLFDQNGTGPDQDQWSRGERWFRCDIVAERPRKTWEGETGKLMRLPRPQRLVDYLQGSPYDWSPYNYCVSQNPEDDSFYMFDCWYADLLGIAWVKPEGTYPGNEDAAFEQMEAQCLKVVRYLVGQTVSQRDVDTFNFSGKLTRANYSRSHWLCTLDKASGR